jgi:NitT/TauT family transport system ATP-binding protein
MSLTPGTGFSVSGICKAYQTRAGAIHALSQVSFRVAPSEFVCVVGPSGCGKSTLLKILAGLIAPTEGSLEFDHSIDNHPPENSMIFQEHSLYPWMRVIDNVAFGLEIRGVGKVERQNTAKDLLNRFGLGEFALNYPHELSGGMRKRAVIARAFVLKPQILLMDEPFSSLDAQTKWILQEDLLHWWKEQQQTVVFVTHDIEEAILLGDRILIMTGRPGRIQEEVLIPLSRPRDMRDRGHPVVEELKWNIWRAIEGEVRQSLRSAS